MKNWPVLLLVSVQLNSAFTKFSAKAFYFQGYARWNAQKYQKNFGNTPLSCGKSWSN